MRIDTADGCCCESSSHSLSSASSPQNNSGGPKVKHRSSSVFELKGNPEYFSFALDWEKVPSDDSQSFLKVLIAVPSSFDTQVLFRKVPS